jgi:hypothetical protein
MNIYSNACAKERQHKTTTGPNVLEPFLLRNRSVQLADQRTAHGAWRMAHDEAQLSDLV